MTAKTKEITANGPSALVTLGERMGVEANALFLNSLKKVAFKAPDVTNEQMMALVVVANQYKLNPFTRELYAFPDKGGGIVPIVSVDGWFRIINEHPQLDGIEYREGDDGNGELYGEATIHRKDRTRPTVIREYLKEVRRNTDPWKQHTHRMLRHKTIIQAARVAFGFAGIYEPDEGERILQSERTVRVAQLDTGKGSDKVRALLDAKNPEPDPETTEPPPPTDDDYPPGDPESDDLGKDELPL